MIREVAQVRYRYIWVKVQAEANLKYVHPTRGETFSQQPSKVKGPGADIEGSDSSSS